MEEFTNSILHSHQNHCQPHQHCITSENHQLSKHAEILDEPISQPLATAPSLQQATLSATATTLQQPSVSASMLKQPLSYTPVPRDPCLPYPLTLLQYIIVFIDDYIVLAHSIYGKYVRNTLFHAINSFFRPNDFYYSEYHREPVSLKKLRKWDCSWSTIKLVLGWVINTVGMTIELPYYWQEQLDAVLSSIPSTQKYIGAKKWHRFLILKLWRNRQHLQNIWSKSTLHWQIFSTKLTNIYHELQLWCAVDRASSHCSC